jgi:hypothetical protein
VDGERVGARDIDIAPDGTLLAVVSIDGGVHRLSPDAAAWVASPPLHDVGFDEVAALSDGGALVGVHDAIWRLGPSGEPVWRRRAPPDELGQPSTGHLVALPGGGVAAIGAGGSGLAAFDGQGRRQRLGSASITGLTALADGTLIEQLGIGAIRMRGSGETPQTLFGLTPRLGRGDGGPATGALFEMSLAESDALAVNPAGELLVADDVTLDASGQLDMQAFRFGRRLVTDFDVPQRHGELLRIVGPGPRPVAAIRQETYRTITRRTVSVTSSFAGTATLRVRNRRRTMAEVTAALPAGDSTLVLPRRLAPGDYRLEFTVADGVRRVTHRIGLSTRRKVELARARRAVRRALRDYAYGGGGAYYELLARGCGRTTAGLIRCALWSRHTNFNDVEERCRGRVVARQRPDGLRVELRQGRSLCLR